MLNPIKVRILEIMNDQNSRWNYEIVKQICNEYSINSIIGRDYINFDLIELNTNGFIEDVEQIVDENELFKKDYLLHKYKITESGKDKIANLI